LEKEWVGSLNLPKDSTGTVVVEVESDGPAEKSGIKANDVIVEINGIAIRSHEELVSKIGLMKPGTKAELGLYREGKKRSVSITIGDWPGSKEIVAEIDKKGKDKSTLNSLGLELSSIKYEGKWALKINQVASNAPAARAGLQSGDVILGINGYSNNKELMDKFRAGEIKDTILLLVERSAEDPRSRRKVRERFLVSIRATTN
jgi:serine protease Do